MFVWEDGEDRSFDRAKCADSFVSCLAIGCRKGKSPTGSASTSRPSTTTRAASIFHQDDRLAKRYDWEAIRAAYESGLSRMECMQKFGFSADAWHKAVKRGTIVSRPVAKPIDAYLVVGRRTGRTHLKARLIQEGLKENRCEICGIKEWLGKPLSMQLHHLNGDGSDNRIENLQLLCGNCHSQTDTYGGRNGHRRKRHLRLVDPMSGDQEDVA